MLDSAHYTCIQRRFRCPPPTWQSWRRSIGSIWAVREAALVQIYPLTSESGHSDGRCSQTPCCPQTPKSISAWSLTWWSEPTLDLRGKSQRTFTPGGNVTGVSLRTDLEAQPVWVQPGGWRGSWPHPWLWSTLVWSCGVGYQDELETPTAPPAAGAWPCTRMMLKQ